MTDTTRAVLSRIDMALAANESADAVAWLEADFERKYAARAAGEWWPSNHVRPMVELLDDEMCVPMVAAPVATLTITVDTSAFEAAIRRIADGVALSFQEVDEAIGKFMAAFHAPLDAPARFAAMRTAYDHRRRARRRRNRR